MSADLLSNLVGVLGVPRLCLFESSMETLLNITWPNGPPFADGAFHSQFSRSIDLNGYTCAAFAAFHRRSHIYSPLTIKSHQGTSFEHSLIFLSFLILYHRAHGTSRTKVEISSSSFHSLSKYDFSILAPESARFVSQLLHRPHNPLGIRSPDRHPRSDIRSNSPLPTPRHRVPNYR